MSAKCLVAEVKAQIGDETANDLMVNPNMTR